jgi:1-deoxy-D-xylulose-5-phosphate synthase
MEEAIPGAFARPDERDERVSYLEGISSPADVRALGAEQLKVLAQEVRAFIINLVAAKGGHFASSLGVVELTLALHKVF